MKMSPAKPSALELSNVGRLTPSTEIRGYQIKTLLFIQSAGACGGAIKAKVNMATGRLVAFS